MDKLDYSINIRFLDLATAEKKLRIVVEEIKEAVAILEKAKIVTHKTLQLMVTI